MCAIGSSVPPSTASILPIYVPSFKSTIIEPRAGDEPVKEASKPPSWLMESIVPLNIVLYFQILNQSSLLLPNIAAPSSVTQRVANSDALGNPELSSEFLSESLFVS
tara:strand:+ start:442 stop:762 length:321 start_codon:yes stop_codon:yes gene_type:complete